jgi:hypothetical protein
LRVESGKFREVESLEKLKVLSGKLKELMIFL